MSASRASIIHPADRLGLSRAEAAAYIGVSSQLFDQMVEIGYMPKPKRFNSRLLWDRRQVEVYFANLPDGDEKPKKNKWLDLEV